MTIVLMSLYIILLASATIVEKYHGTTLAKDLFYYSPVTILLLVLLVINFILFVGKHQYLKNRRLGLAFTHVAFMIILAGALTTHLTGKDGIVHIREGESTDVMLVQKGNSYEAVPLPFSVRLNDFILKRYPGSSSPSSYESMITVTEGDRTTDAHIYMNNVLDINGYRFFQSSYDQDEKGSILSVSHDVLGRNITYTGYVVLFVGLVLSLCERRGRFRTLYARLKSINNSSLLIIVMMTLSLPAFAEEKAMDMIEKYTVKKEHAHEFGRLALQGVNGRMMPVNTFSSEILRKLYKANTIGKLDSDQFLLSLFIMPDVWMRVPLFAVDDEELAGRLNLKLPHCSYADMFDAEENYKLEDELETIYRKNPAERNRMDKAILKLDEQVNIFHSLVNRRYINIFPLPGDANHTWYAPGDELDKFSGQDSMFVANIFDWYLEEVTNALASNDWSEAGKVLGMIDTYQQAKATGVDISHYKMNAEIQYNKLNIFKYCRMGYLILGGISLVFAMFGLFGMANSKVVKWTLVACIAMVFGFHLYGMGIRWYIGGYAPWSNSYETMVYVACTMVIAGFIFVKRNLFVFSLATLFSGVILFVSGLNWMDPQITTLVPVLKSPWLMFHVAVIVAAYGFFALGCLTGMTNLILMISARYAKDRKSLAEKIHEFSIMNEMALWIGLVLMTTGTFLGAVWANESWGRYWGWDPKETWALITMVAYAIVTHIHVIKTRYKDWLFNFLSVVSISTVLMTFFGVNYFLSGMHSYGQNDNISNLFVWIALAFAIVVILGICSFYSTKHSINLLKKTES